MVWFSVKWLEKWWYAVKQNNEPTNQSAILNINNLYTVKLFPVNFFSNGFNWHIDWTQTGTMA